MQPPCSLPSQARPSSGSGGGGPPEGQQEAAVATPHIQHKRLLRAIVGARPGRRLRRHLQLLQEWG